MSKELVTVIIPTYNRARLIKRAIYSVLNQSYNNIELIIVDDASTDNTEEVVKSIDDDRIKYIKLESNKGACNARNIAIKEAKGKYITFQDSDDEYHREKIEKQLDNLLRNDSDLDFCKIKIINNGKSFVFPNEKQKESIKNNKILDELCNGNFISTQAIFVKTDCIKEYLFDAAMPRLQDFDLVLRMVPKIKISFTDEILADLYTQDDSISNSPTKLKSAIILFLKKQYGLNDYQKTNLINYLLNSNPDNSSKYEELYKNFIVLRNNYEKLNNDYQNIVNSRRWKVMDNICNKIKK